jgi:hypothetical protein
MFYIYLQTDTGEHELGEYSSAEKAFEALVSILHHNKNIDIDDNFYAAEDFELDAFSIGSPPDENHREKIWHIYYDYDFSKYIPVQVK